MSDPSPAVVLLCLGGVAGRRKMGSVVVDPICIDLNAKGIFL